MNGPGNTLFVQKLDLGWVLVSDVCLGDVHWPTVHSQLVKDKYFLMNTFIFHDKSKSWVAPLPSKAISSKQSRTSYDSPLFSKMHPRVKFHLAFIQRVFDNNHAELGRGKRVLVFTNIWGLSPKKARSDQSSV